METITKTFEVYEFNELSEKIQAKVLDRYRDINIHSDWSEYTFDYWVTQLNELGFNVSAENIQYSGFCCQGDGASFTCKTVDIEKLIKSLDGRIDSERLRQYARFLPRIKDYIDLSVDRSNKRYCHEHTCNINFDVWRFGTEAKVFKLVKQFADDIEALRLECSKKIYKDLYNEYFELISDENVKESIICNEMKFLANGETF